MCYTDWAENAQQHPGTKTATKPAEHNRKMQSKPYEIQPNSNTIGGGGGLMHLWH